MYIRLIPKIHDLQVIKLSLSLGNSLKDLAILATYLMLLAERFCVEVVTGAREGCLLERREHVMPSRHGAA